MKKYIKYIIIAAIFVFVVIQRSYCQSDNGNQIIMQAMKDEMQRNIQKLTLENLSNPFFISYTLGDEHFLTVQSSLGSLIGSKEYPKREQNMRVMVGDYKLNDENYVDANFWGGDYRRGEIPLENDYNGIRRALWLMTDGLYKSAAEMKERKLSAMKQQSRTAEEDSLSDFSRAPKVSLILPSVKVQVDKALCEKNANELSALFVKYPDIYSSNVIICIYSADLYYINTEGTQTIYPVMLTGLLINANTQAEDGEPLTDHLIYYGNTYQDIPSQESIKNEITEMINNLQSLRKAPIFNDSYSGPVLFEGQAAGELMSQRLFSGSESLIAERTPIYSDPSASYYSGGMKSKSLEDKIGRKVISNDITITSMPKLNNYNGRNLIGKFDVDAEGVVPSDELVLVDKGILKTMLNSRIPTQKLYKSNGYNRIMSCGVSSATGPGVVKITSTNKSNEQNLKEKLINTAKNEGLDYAIIVRKFMVKNAGTDVNMLRTDRYSYGMDKQKTMSKPIYMYKVYVKDGREELVRSAKFGGISGSALKRILSVSDKEMVYNTLSNTESRYYYYSDGLIKLNGIPSSFIMPKSLLIEELDIEKEKRAYTPKLPLVSNPVKFD